MWQRSSTAARYGRQLQRHNSPSCSDSELADENISRCRWGPFVRNNNFAINHLVVRSCLEERPGARQAPGLSSLFLSRASDYGNESRRLGRGPELARSSIRSQYQRSTGRVWPANEPCASALRTAHQRLSRGSRLATLLAPQETHLERVPTEPGRLVLSAEGRGGSTCFRCWTATRLALVALQAGACLPAAIRHRPVACNQMCLGGCVCELDWRLLISAMRFLAATRDVPLGGPVRDLVR